MASTRDKTAVYELGNINEYLIAAGTIIYEGSAIGDNGDGYSRPLQKGDVFRGFAERHEDNLLGSDGEKRIRVKKYGAIVLDIDNLSLADTGKAVYAIDDNTFTLAKEGNSYIGTVSRYIENNTGLVEFHAYSPNNK